MLLLLFFILLLHPPATSVKFPGNAGLHYQLYRRGGRFTSHEHANLTRLLFTLSQAEQRYSRTYREVQHNRLVRRWNPESDEEHMLDEVGMSGTWYFTLDIGTPKQTIEVDLDMLSPDFYSVMTSSGQGSKYDTFLSQSHESSTNVIHPICRLEADSLHLTQFEQTRFTWPICRASKSSRHTLHNSGTVFGLSPHSSAHASSLSRWNHPNLLSQLHGDGVIPQQIWSITLLDSTNGILSLGSTVAKEMEEAKARPELELQYFGREKATQAMEDKLRDRLNLLGLTAEEQFKWIEVQGSSGWWTGLISSVWVNGVKVLKNQPFVLDLNCPFILAPPSVFSHFHQSISGSRVLGHPYDHFAIFPCLNPPHMTFEIAGWQFPVMSRRTREDDLYGPAGGPFSLGKLDDICPSCRTESTSTVNSGFCVAAVIQSTMGERRPWRNSGMKDVWVLGEPFFRGLGLVFDPGKKSRVGLRVY